VQAQVRRRVLRGFVRRGWLSEEDWSTGQLVEYSLLNQSPTQPITYSTNQPPAQTRPRWALGLDAHTPGAHRPARRPHPAAPLASAPLPRCTVTELAPARSAHHPGPRHGSDTGSVSRCRAGRWRNARAFAGSHPVGHADCPHLRSSSLGLSAMGCRAAHYCLHYRDHLGKAAFSSTSASPPKRPCSHPRALRPPGMNPLTRRRSSTRRRLRQSLSSSSTEASAGSPAMGPSLRTLRPLRRSRRLPLSPACPARLLASLSQARRALSASAGHVSTPVMTLALDRCSGSGQPLAR
jgi:hypothetical protein